MSADYIALLTRVYDCDPQLAHSLRVAAHQGRFSAEQERRVVALLRKLEPRKKEER